MTQHYRADFPAWIFVSVVSLLPWLAVLGSTVHGGVDVTGLALAAGVSAFSFGWLSSFRITLKPNEIVFRSLFGGRQSIPHGQVKRVRLAYSAGSSTRGPWRLVVEPQKSSGAEELNINAKVFSKAAINAVLDVGRRIAEADDGGLLDGIVVKKVRDSKRRKRK